jgi:hypothetical protein
MRAAVVQGNGDAGCRAKKHEVASEDSAPEKCPGEVFGEAGNVPLILNEWSGAIGQGPIGRFRSPEHSYGG